MWSDGIKNGSRNAAIKTGKTIQLYIDSQAAILALWSNEIKIKTVTTTIKALESIGEENDVKLNRIKTHNDDGTHLRISPPLYWRLCKEWEPHIKSFTGQQYTGEYGALNEAGARAERGKRVREVLVPTPHLLWPLEDIETAKEISWNNWRILI